MLLLAWLPAAKDTSAFKFLKQVHDSSNMGHPVHHMQPMSIDGHKNWLTEPQWQTCLLNPIGHLRLCMQPQHSAHSMGCCLLAAVPWWCRYGVAGFAFTVLIGIFLLPKDTGSRPREDLLLAAAVGPASQVVTVVV